jgi:hypothetical protein
MRDATMTFPLRLATNDDSAALCRLFSSVPMRGEVQLITRREPNFFALYDLQGGHYETHVYEKLGNLVAMGSVLVRPGFLNGAPAQVGYLGDLRSSFAATRERALPRLYGEVLRRAATEFGCQQFLTAVMASNFAARNALARRNPRRTDPPVYTPLREYRAVNVSLLGRRRTFLARGRIEVRAAQLGDVPQLQDFLSRDHTNRAFGWRFDLGELQHRLHNWPGFTLSHTYLAHDANGELLGCTTAWDPAPVKRYEVQAYHGSMRWARLAARAWEALSGISALPPPGEAFRSVYLCNTSVANHDPVVFRALLDRIYLDHRSLGYHFIMLYMERDDPLTSALRGFLVRSLDFVLYGVATADAAPLVVQPGPTGFEMALA